MATKTAASCRLGLYPGVLAGIAAVLLLTEPVVSAGQHTAEVSADAQRRPEEDRSSGAAGDP